MMLVKSLMIYMFHYHTGTHIVVLYFWLKGDFSSRARPLEFFRKALVRSFYRCLWVVMSIRYMAYLLQLPLASATFLFWLSKTPACGWFLLYSVRTSIMTLCECTAKYQHCAIKYKPSNS